MDMDMGMDMGSKTCGVVCKYGKDAMASSNKVMPSDQMSESYE